MSMPTIARSKPRTDTELRRRVPIGIAAKTGMHASRVATTRPDSSPEPIRTISWAKPVMKNSDVTERMWAPRGSR